MGFTDNSYEKCINCISCAKIYKPDVKEYAHIPSESYVCTLFYEDKDCPMSYKKQVSYIGKGEGLCEMFSPIDKEEWIRCEPKPNNLAEQFL